MSCSNTAAWCRAPDPRSSSEIHPVALVQRRPRGNFRHFAAPPELARHATAPTSATGIVMNLPTSFRHAVRALAFAGAGLGLLASPALAQYRQHITNDPARCRGGGAAVNVTVTGIRSSAGT